MKPAHILLILLLFSRIGSAAVSDCITPPTSDDPKVDLKRREDCEKEERRLEAISKNKSQMEETAKKGCAPNCPDEKKEQISGQYEIFCQSYCQSIVPEQLASNISCTPKKMCGWSDGGDSDKWKSLGYSCMQGVPEGGKKFLQELADTSEALQMAPRRLMESSWNFAKNVWHYGFHDAANMEVIAADESVREKIKSIRALPTYFSNQYEVLKCLKPEVAAKLACNLGTVLLLDAASGYGSYKLASAAARAEMLQKAYDLTAAAEKESAVGKAMPSEPTASSVALNPETGLPVFPKQALAKDLKSLEDLKGAAVPASTADEGAQMIRRAQLTYTKAKEKGDPQIQFLERAGYDFTPASAKTVSAEKIGSTYNQEILKIAKEKGLKPEEILQAARPYELPNGKKVLITSGDPIPEGAKPASLRLSDREFLEMLGQGKFPMGEGKAYGPYPLSLKEHDAAHLSSFEEYPEVMPEITKEVRALKARGGFEKHYNVPDDDNTDPVRLRVFSTLETSSFYTASAQKKLTGLSGLKSGQIAKPSDLKKTFGQMKGNELSQWVDRVSQVQSEEIKHFGGGARDIIHREYDSNVLNISRTQHVTRELERLQKLKQTDPKKFEEEARKTLPVMVSTQWNFSQMDPVMMIRGSFRPNSTEGLRLKEIQCASPGLFKQEDREIKLVFGC